LDPESPDSDALLARHLVSLYEDEDARRAYARNIPYSTAQLSEYISYAYVAFFFLLLHMCSSFYITLFSSFFKPFSRAHVNLTKHEL
jgi:hypothetical protein